MDMNSVQGPGTGLFLDNKFVVVWNRSGGARSIGDVMMFDLASVEAETTESIVPGAEANPLGNATLPTTLGIGGLSGASLDTGNRIGYFFGIVTDLLADAGADNKKVKLQVTGIVNALHKNDTIKPGYPLFPANGAADLTTTLAAGNKCIAIARVTTGGTAGLYSTIFDGIHGFGQLYAS